MCRMYNTLYFCLNATSKHLRERLTSVEVIVHVWKTIMGSDFHIKCHSDEVFTRLEIFTVTLVYLLVRTESQIYSSLMCVEGHSLNRYDMHGQTHSMHVSL